MEILNGGTADFIRLRKSSRGTHIWLLWAVEGVSMTWQGENRHPKPPVWTANCNQARGKWSLYIFYFHAKGFKHLCHKLTSLSVPSSAETRGVLSEDPIIIRETCLQRPAFVYPHLPGTEICLGYHCPSCGTMDKSPWMLWLILGLNSWNLPAGLEFSLNASEEMTF